MPALKEDYDYYGYARSRQGVARSATPVSRSTPKASNAHKPTSDVTKMATRNALRDDFIGTTKKTSTKSQTTKTTGKKSASRIAEIEPVVFQKKQAKTMQKPEELKLKKMQVAKKEKAKKIAKQKAKAKANVRTFLGGLCLFAMFFMICLRYTIINEAFNEVNDMKASLREKETVNAQLESNIKQNTDLSYIEKYAKYQLRNAETKNCSDSKNRDRKRR